MKNYSDQSSTNMDHIKGIVKRIFPPLSLSIERVAEGLSTYVYRLSAEHETFYLRVLPEEGASFAPEVLAHSLLRERQVKVPEVIYFEHHNELLQRSLMITTEIKGQPISRSLTLSRKEREAIVVEAGRDLAMINAQQIEGFGWIQRDEKTPKFLRGEWPTYRAFVLEHWEADLAYLAKSTLSDREITMLRRICDQYDSYFECEQGYLAHGDFDTTHIYQHEGRYTGIIDFGEMRGSDHWYDLGHFHMRDGEQLLVRLEGPLIQGYRDITALPSNYERRIRFTSLLINVRTLARSLQKRPANQYTQHQLQVLQEDLIFFQQF